MTSAAAARPVRVMSFNIWTESAFGSRWLERKDRVASTLRFHSPHVAGLQEATATMIGDLMERLSGYSWIGGGREDGSAAGEYNPIFYRQDRFTLEQHGTFWLAPDPARPGKGWDAACIRICTWARLQELETGLRYLHFNTHLDHIGRRARRESATLLLQKMEEISQGLPVVLTGDLNCRDTSDTYRLLTAAGALLDARSASLHGHHGPSRTWRGFFARPLRNLRIDYIMVGKEVTVLQHATLADHWDGGPPSDHMPVVAELLLPQPQPGGSG